MIRFGRTNRTGTIARGTFLASVAGLALCPASAQEVMPINPSPPQRLIDVNNVDLASGVVALTKVLVSGGDPARPLAAVVNIHTADPGVGASDPLNFDPTFTSIYVNPGYLETVGTPIGSFVLRSQATGPINWGLGPTPGGLDANGAFFNRNGDRFVQGTALPNMYSVIYADGETWTYYYATVTYANGYNGVVLKFIVSNRGYGLQFGDNIIYSTYFKKKITFYNKAFVYCDEAQLVDCSAVSSLPTAGTMSSEIPAGGLGNPQYFGGFNGPAYGVPTSYPSLSVTTYAAPGEQGLTVYYGSGADGSHSFTDILKVENAGVASSARTYKYVHIGGNGDGASGMSGLLSANDGNSTWNYTVADDPIEPPDPLSVNGFGATDPNNNTYSASAINLLGAPTSMTDQLNRSVYAGYSAPDYRLTTTYQPEGDSAAYTNDSRGNITQERRTAKPGSGLPDLVRTSGYDATCVNILTCNKPNWTKDFKGNQTDITYNSNNGAVATVTGPADANGVRPQKRYTYVQRYAWILNGSGGYVHAASPVWLPDTESFCRASAATGNQSTPCAGNDEVKTSYEYGPDSGPNNLFLRGKAVTADGVTLRTCYSNDQNGRRISETSPRANLTVCP